MALLEIKNLHVVTEGKSLLKGLSLNIGAGEIHAIMGPNGMGKSTLAKVLAGDPAYEVSSGEIRFQGEDLLALEPEERVFKGLFMGFQNPPEIPGVTNEQFLYQAYNSIRKGRGETPMEEKNFSQLLQKKAEQIEGTSAFAQRFINVGFSGGEKKRNEILQMALLEPLLAILDEMDSGLDIDAMRKMAHAVNLLKKPEKAILLITHYQRLLDYIQPDYVHVLIGGKIVRSGGALLAKQLEERGYQEFSDLAVVG